MVKKDQKWEWMEKQEGAFKELKEQFTKEPVLVVPKDEVLRAEIIRLHHDILVVGYEGRWKTIVICKSTCLETTSPW